MSRLLIKADHALLCDERGTKLKDAALIVENGKIAAIGKAADLESQGSFSERIGGNGFYLLPGLVNAHYHAGNIFRLGLPDEHLEAWLIGVHATGDGMTEEALYDLTLLHACEQLKNGITSCFDNMPVNQALPFFGTDAVVRAYSDVGMRVVIAPIFRNQNSFVYDSDDTFLAGLPQLLRENVERIITTLGAAQEMSIDLYLETMGDMVARHHGAQNGLVQIGLSPYGLQWCTDDGFSAIKEHAEDWQVRIQMHLLETRYEKQYAERVYGCSAVAHLQRLGFLGEEVSLAHGVWLDDTDLSIISDSGAVLVHNPTSNLRLASGMAKVTDWVSAGVKCALGTDALSVGGGNDLLADVRVADYVQRQPGIDGVRLDRKFWLETMTSRGSKAFNNTPNFGSLEIGKRADLVLIRDEKITSSYINPLIPDEEKLLHFVDGADVDTVLVDGKILVREGEVLHIDESRLRERVKEGAAFAMQGLQRRLPTINELKSHVKHYFREWDQQT